MPKNYDRFNSPGESLDKNLQREDQHEIENEMAGRKFLNQVWWIDIAMGLLGFAVVVLANRLFIISSADPENPGKFRMIWAILQPLGVIVGIRFFVGVSKFIKRIRS